MLPSSQIQRENSGDFVPLGKYSSKVCHIDPIPDLGTDTSLSEEILYPEYRIPIDSDFIVPTALDELVDPTKLIHKFLPKQGEIECLIKHINRMVLIDVNLPGCFKDLKAAYLTSPHFRDIYLYLLQNKVHIIN